MPKQYLPHVHKERAQKKIKQQKDIDKDHMVDMRETWEQDDWIRFNQYIDDVIKGE